MSSANGHAAWATPGLGDLLAAAATGDEQSFLTFYDRTAERVFALELARARSRGLGGPFAQRAAAAWAERRFAEAWRLSARQATSGLSALAWLLSLEVPSATAAAPREQTAFGDKLEPVPVASGR